jgi:pimeloyl-ACP methyl ester carboxylesterase
VSALPRPAELITVRAGDVSLGARRWAGGHRIPVLLVHGLASNARTWDGVAAALARAGHPVLAVDLRRHASSTSVQDVPGSDPTVAAADDLAGVCATLGWSRLLLAGHSWGGNIALQLTCARPDLVAGLVLVDGGWLHLGHRFADLGAAWRTLAPPDLTGWDAEALREVAAAITGLG